MKIGGNGMSDGHGQGAAVGACNRTRAGLQQDMCRFGIVHVLVYNRTCNVYNRTCEGLEQDMCMFTAGVRRGERSAVAGCATDVRPSGNRTYVGLQQDMRFYSTGHVIFWNRTCVCIQQDMYILATGHVHGCNRTCVCLEQDMRMF